MKYLLFVLVSSLIQFVNFFSKESMTLAKTGVWEESPSRLGVRHGKSLQADNPLQVTRGVSANVTSGFTLAARGITAPIVSSPKLQNMIKDLFKGVGKPGSIGTGTTADAIRNELKTGLATGGRFHSTKGAEYARGLEKWLQSNPNASYHDRLVAQSLMDDLNRAISGY